MKSCQDIEIYNSLVRKINEIIGELSTLNNHKLEVQRIENKCIELKQQIENESYQTLTEIQNEKQQILDIIINNNAEVVASRGSFESLPIRLDDFELRTDSIINQRNVLGDKSIRTKSWGTADGDYSITDHSIFSNAIKVVNGSNKTFLFKDIDVSKIPSGNYVFNFKCLNNADFNLYATISIMGYPTTQSSGGTVLFTQNDVRCYDYQLNEGYQKTELKFNINTSGYHHCRLMIQCRTKNQTYNLTDIYLGLENTVCNEFSYIDYKLNMIDNNTKILENLVTNLQTSKLNGKTLYLNGDSITYGAGSQGGYGKILADKYGCIVTNEAVSGGTLATGTTYSNGSPKHHISESVVSSVNKQYDYMILSGGFNDYGSNVPIGTLSDSQNNFSNPVTTDNVIGALETMFRHILQNYPSTKLYFLITHKANRCTNQTNSIGKTMQDYVNAIKSVCERYSIPIINVWEESRMITAYSNIANKYTNESDKIHPNELGYKEFYLPVIEKALGL